MAKTNGKLDTAKKKISRPKLTKIKQAGNRRAEAVSSPAAAENGDAVKAVRNYKKHTKKLIATEFQGIMKSMAEKSKQGSLGHTKFLFEIGGVKEDLERQGRGKPEPSLADLLMAEIKRQNTESRSIIEHPSSDGEVLGPLAVGETGEGETD